jgi:hypothetical protein
MLCQVDDFLLALPTPELADHIFTCIGTLLQQPNEPDIPFINEGIATEFNGIGVVQTHD